MKRRSILRPNRLNVLLLAVGLGLGLTSMTGQEAPSSAPTELEASERRIQANARFAAGIGKQAKGQMEGAAQDLLTATEIDPTNQALLLRVAQKLREWRLPTLAIQVLDKASTLKNPDVDIFVQKGLTLKLLKQEEAALEAFQAALKISPGNALARKELAIAKLQAKDVPGALQIIRDGVALPSLAGDQLVGLVELYLQTIATDPTRMGDLSGELKNLLARTEKYELERPEEEVVLADGFTFVGELETAQSILKNVLQQNPTTALAREKLVDLYLREGNTADAVGELNTLLDQNPKNPSAHYLLGSIAADNQEYPAAIDHYEKAIELRPEFEPPYYEVVGIHLNSRQPRKALDILSRARIRFPKRFLGEFYTGIAFASLRRTREALTHLLEAESIATKQSPQRLTPFFYFQLGSMFERNGKLDQAEANFLKSLEANPDDAETLNYLGYMWAEQGKKLSQAEEWIRKALKLEPDSAAIQDSLGWVLFKQGKHEKALPFLLNAEAGLDQPDPVILDHLGDAYEALGKTTEARKAWETSLELEFNEHIFQKLQSLNASN